MKRIKLAKLVGPFAEDKETARNIRIKEIIPALEKNEDIVLDIL